MPCFTVITHVDDVDVTVCVYVCVIPRKYRVCFVCSSDDVRGKCAAIFTCGEQKRPSPNLYISIFNLRPENDAENGIAVDGVPVRLRYITPHTITIGHRGV